MLSPGTHELGPENGTLLVRTGRKGAAAKAGHDLLIRVTAWKATIDVGDGITISLDADPTSLRVLEGTGGMQALDDGDRDNIRQTIDDEVLLRQGIAFRSTSAVAAGDGSRITVKGDLPLVGATRPIAFDVIVGDGGKLSGSTVITQSDWGIKPYSALSGALKVTDEIEIEIDDSMPSS